MTTPANSVSSISRRQAITTLAVAAVVTSIPIHLASGAPPEFDWESLTVDEWLAIKGRDLPEIANLLATVSRQSIEEEFPRIWRSQWFAQGCEYRPGIAYVYGFNGREPSPPERDGIYECIEDAGFEILAAGWSADRRSWTLLVRGESDDVRKLLGAEVVEWENTEDK